MAVKYFIGLIVGLIATLFFGLSAGLAVYIYESGTTKNTYSFLETCTKVGDTTSCVMRTEGSCAEFNQAHKAGAAFSIVATVVAGVWFFLTILRVLKPLVYVALGFLKVLNFILILGALVTGILDWIIAFALFASKFCDEEIRNTAGTSVGPAGPLAFVATVLLLIQFILEIVMDDDSVAEATSAQSNAPTA